MHINLGDYLLLLIPVKFHYFSLVCSSVCYHVSIVQSEDTFFFLIASIVNENNSDRQPLINAHWIAFTK